MVNTVTDACLIAALSKANSLSTIKARTHRDVTPGLGHNVTRLARARHLQADILKTIQLKPKVNNKSNRLLIVLLTSTPSPNNAKKILIVVQSV